MEIHTTGEGGVRTPVAGVGAVLVTAFAACVWPMLHIARLEPVEAMRV